MTNELLQVKFQQRLNKLSSNDYGNIECWMIAEAFNKAMDAWVSRQLQGINQTKSTAEGSIRSIDKLQVILTQTPLTMTDQGIYWETTLPTNYVEWSRISAEAKIDDCCPARKLKIFLGEEADIDMVLLDKNRQPSYEWGETVATVMSGTFRIYTNKCFELINPTITYYRKAAHIQIAGCTNPDTGLPVTTNVECEFSNTVIETLIDEGAAILADDMDNYNKMQVLSQNAEHSN
jgi:hypothetical protein